MPADDVAKFFQRKKTWSQYKDLILDYYLKPYLAKVAQLRRPIFVVDCFAGAGQFGCGSPGSPLIIAKRLKEVQDRGIRVSAMFIEADADLCSQLKSNTQDLSIPINVRYGDFKDYVGEIVHLATTHTVFVYVDPIKPSHLKFDDLRAVYQKLHSGHSVETLINFLSRGFLRRAEGLLRKATQRGVLDREHAEVKMCDEIAGGVYWQDIVCDSSLSEYDKTTQVAHGFADRLRQWFRYSLAYPVKRKYRHQLPKYHLVFGSRHPDALELMNRAMVTARRQSVCDEFEHGMLFPNQPATEVVDSRIVMEHVISTLRRAGKTTWKRLRVEATMAAPCRFLDTELNNAIKAAIMSGRIASSAVGNKIVNSSDVWIPE